MSAGIGVSTSYVKDILENFQPGLASWVADIRPETPCFGDAYGQGPRPTTNLECGAVDVLVGVKREILFVHGVQVGTV